jgi:microcystin-dependent protein
MYPIDTQDGLFHDGNGINELGTVLPASWLNQIQAELLAILTAAKIKPEKATNNQVLMAIKLLISMNKPADATAESAGITKVIDSLISKDRLSALSANQGRILNESKLDKDGIAKAAAKLQQARSINGIPFDGTSDINVTPAGAVQYFLMRIPPVGWLVADGSAISRSAYANLFAAIGTAFGAGDGKTTFNLPDIRGEFIRGWDAGRGVDTGREFGTWQDSENKSHQHKGETSTAGSHQHGGSTDWAGEHTHPVGRTGGGNGTHAAESFVGRGGEIASAGNHRHGFNTDWSGNHNHSFSTSWSGGGESRGRNIALLACIKT